MDDETYEYEKIPFLEAIEVARDKGLIKLNRITYSRYKTLLDLIGYGILKKQLSGVKVLGNGELTKKVTVKANKFSQTAVEKIEAIGGKAEVI